jgi:hypothetical protein
MSDLFTEIGINLTDLIAGAAGGIVRHIMLMRGGAGWSRSEIGNVFLSSLVGALMAAYLGGWLARMTGVDPAAAGFVVGLAGLALCQVVVEQVLKRWRLGPPT